jgi:adenosylcobinamide-GDP ribazoletransferase
MALIVVIGLQTGALAALFATPGGAILAGLCVIASRAALAVCCLRGVPPARADGLGVSYAGTVPWLGAAIIWVLIAATLASAGGWAGLPWWRGALAVTLALVCVAALLRRIHRRLGGVSGDVFGASVELTLACLLSALA